MNGLHAQIQPADARQRVVDPLALERELLFIAHMTQGAAAAFGIVGAVGRLTHGGGGQDFGHPAPSGGLSHLHQRDPADLAPQRALYKHGHAV